MLRLPSLPRRMREQRGFTLVETLVAMLTGIIVTGALFAILEFSVRQASYISQTAQASQVSRTAMTHIVDELHSACLSPDFAPVQKGSSSTMLIFQNGYSEEAEVPGAYTSSGGTTKKRTEGVRQDTIEWEEGKGYLVDKVAPGTGAEAENKFPVGAATTVRLATNVSQGEVKGEKVAIFRYYKYALTPSTSTTAAASSLEEMPLAKGATLTEEQADKVAAVEIRFKTGSYTKEGKVSKTQEATIPSELVSQTTFAFSAPNSEATIAVEPCE